MSDEQELAPEADQIVAPIEADEKAEEETEAEQGQDDSQPAEDEAEDANSEEEKPSESKLRRERRKAMKERLIKEASDARAEAEAAKAELARIEQVTQSSVPPKEGDFDTFEEYQAALSGFHSLKMLDDRRRKEIADKAETSTKRVSAFDAARQEELRSNWREQLAEAETKYTDFKKVFTDDLPVTVTTAEILADSDVGIDIAYHLGTHRAEAAQIAALPPMEQARRLGMIEARLTAVKPQLTSSAPDPITPVRGKASVSKPVDQMTMAEYMAARKSGKLK